MKKGIVIALLVAFSAFAFAAVVVTAAENPDGTMKLDAPAKVFPVKKLNPDGTKKKNPVTFNHKKHGDLGCPTCHHTDKELKAGGTTKSCFECHGPEAKTVDGKAQLDTYAMVHDKKVGKCLACHTTDAKAQAAKAPTKCKECHGGGDE